MTTPINSTSKFPSTLQAENGDFIKKEELRLSSKQLAEDQSDLKASDLKTIDDIVRKMKNNVRSILDEPHLQKKSEENSVLIGPLHSTVTLKLPLKKKPDISNNLLPRKNPVQFTPQPKQDSPLDLYQLSSLEQLPGENKD